MDWDHLRTFESVARLGSLTAAAKALGISQSTVSRQLQRLEARAGSPLLVRDSPVSLTTRGAALLAAMAPMTTAALAAEAALDDEAELEGSVVVSTVGELIRWALLPALPRFYARHPRLRLDLLADNRILSLAAGDADVALRFVRPERGDLIARRVHTEHYGLFVSQALDEGGEMPWLGLAGSLADLAEQLFAQEVFAGRDARLRVEDLESLGMAVRDGLGAAVLPRGFAGQLPGVVELDPAAVGAESLGPPPSRSLWMVVHASKARVPKVRAVLEWLAAVFAGLPSAAPRGPSPQGDSRP